VADIRSLGQVRATVSKAAGDGGTIVHTLVDARLRGALIQQAREQHVVEIDLMGVLIARLRDVLDQEPIAQPGRYRQLRQDYFDRVAAIEFSIAHDDGKRPGDWPEAEIVLTGVSRVGKTPLSMYLAVQGWRVANVPLILDVPTPPPLLALDRRRVFGLDMEPGQLLFYRRQRQSRLGVSSLGAYTDPARILEELEAARQVFRQNRFSVIDVTDTPIEASADWILNLIARRFGSEAHGR
jgi:regulator of PEP synthase PpsR (kinase-PPPase family)